METYTIQEALKQEKGTIVIRLKAKLINVFPRENKEGQYGPYTKQNGMIEDGTGKMKISVIDFNDLSDRVGSTIIFKSMQGKKGISGVAVDRYEWKGKQEIVLKVSGKMALMVSDGEEDKVQTVKDSPRMSHPIKQLEKQEALPKSEKDIHEDRKLMLATAKNRLTQLAGLYGLCWKTVFSIDLGDRGDFLIDQHKDIATTLFIQAVREGLQDKFPVRTLSKFYNEEALKITDTKNPDMPIDDSPENDDIPF